MLNNDFLEEYKRLDKLCRDMYNSDSGITSYIDEMKMVSGSASDRVFGWNDDLKNLIRLRHIRNSLTHDVGTMNTNMCKQSDIEWLSDFFERIRTGSDPLAVLRKRRISKRNISRTSTYSVPINPEPQQKNEFLFAFVFAFIIFAIIAALALIFNDAFIVRKFGA